MLFDTTHILYMVISFAITIILLICLKMWVKKESIQRTILQVIAWLVILVHYSSLWVEFFQKGEAVADSSMLLLMYPCNIVMWLLLVTSLLKKQTMFYRILVEFTAIVGTVCAIAGIVLNVNYANTPSLLDYDILKGLLSHSVMLVGCLYLFVLGKVKFRVFNTVSIACGLLFFLSIGFVNNTLYHLFGLDPCNSMYMLESPYPELPWLSPYLIGAVAIVLIFSITALYEQFFVERSKRWYVVLKEKRSKKIEE